LAAAPATAWDQPIRQGDAWFIPINVGVGPGLTRLPGVLSDTWFPVLSLDVFGVVDPRIVRHYLQANKHKIPAQYKKYLKNLNTSSPWHLKAGLAKWVPAHLVIAPPNPIFGEDRYAFGVQTDPLLLDVGTGLGATNDAFFLRLHVGAPTLSYHYVKHPALRGKAHIVGAGARGRVQLTWQPDEVFTITLQWLSVVQFTNGYDTKTTHAPLSVGNSSTQLQLWGDDYQRAWHVGTASLLLNVRIPSYLSAGGAGL
jgi:hypothetical protein